MRTVRLKLVLTEEQKGSLLRTMEEYTRAFDHAARWGYEHHCWDKRRLQYEIYYDTRAAVPKLGAGLIQSSKDVACEALKRCKCRAVPKRRTYAAVRYPWKEAKVYFSSGTVSLYSIEGRIHAPVVLYAYLEKYKDWKCKISNLVWNKITKLFFLNVVVENREVLAQSKGDILGIDRGLKNVAVCSNNMFFNSSQINATRGRYAKNKAELQAVGTRSAIRRLRKQSGRERRFVTCENHRISKIIASTEFAVFALEDLANINMCRWLDRRTRGRLRSWAYHQLEVFLRYKAEEMGKAVVLVDPTCTSQWCSRCGWIDKKSRKGNEFHCVKCGFQLNADLNASRIIARLGRSDASRLLIYQPHAAGDEGDVSGVHSK
ncbi:MAG: IS200/IS605 family element transposase accessory protein TnpB [Methanomassiliicoccus sp.]|nr:IS200/IS605 family element transposase accessory protein TnpB [Methanomassiliicoccus sp.]